MHPMRSSMFGRGGPLSTASTAAKLALLTLGVSVIVQLSDVAQAWLPLTPGAVVGRLALWQLLTYIPVTPVATFGFIFVLLIIWSTGSALEMSWGTRRFLSFVVGVPVASAVLTVLLSLVWPSLRIQPFFGGLLVASIIWIAYGLSHGGAQLNFWSIPLSGNAFALIGAGFIALNAVIARSLVPVVPEIFAGLITWGYVRLGSPRVLILKLRHWKLQRELKSRSRHLRVISDDRNTSRGSDRFIH